MYPNVTFDIDRIVMIVARSSCRLVAFKPSSSCKQQCFHRIYILNPPRTKPDPLESAGDIKQYALKSSGQFGSHVLDLARLDWQLSYKCGVGRCYHVKQLSWYWQAFVLWQVFDCTYRANHDGLKSAWPHISFRHRLSVTPDVSSSLSYIPHD